MKKLEASVLTSVLAVHFAKANGGTPNPREQGEESGHGGDTHLGAGSDESRCRKQTCSSKDDRAMNTQEHKTGSCTPGVHELVYTNYLFLCFGVHKGREFYLSIYPQHLRGELGTQ